MPRGLFILIFHQGRSSPPPDNSESIFFEVAAIRRAIPGRASHLTNYSLIKRFGKSARPWRRGCGLEAVTTLDCIRDKTTGPDKTPLSHTVPITFPSSWVGVGVGIPECIPAFRPVNTGTDPSFPSDPRTALNSSNEEMNVLTDQSQGRKAGAEIKKNK